MDKVYKEIVSSMDRIYNNPPDVNVDEHFLVSTFVGFFANHLLSIDDSGDARKEIQKVNKKSFEIQLSTLLKNDSILNEATKLLALMEASENWDEFKSLSDKRKKIKPEPPKQELTDFDKIMKGILKVPKPDKKEKDSQ